MNKQITVSAPGKLMFFGEHAVVYNHPCLVTAVNERMFLTAEIIDTPVFELSAPDVDITSYVKAISDLGQGDIPKGAQFVEIALKNISEKYKISKGCKITTRSEFSSEFGFGSSSASTVCVVKALSELFNLNLSNKELFEFSYKTVLDIQKKGSGFDVAAAVFGETLYFVTGGSVIEPLSIPPLPLLVGYSGVKADTVTLINTVKKLAEEKPEEIDSIYNAIEVIVNNAKTAILENNLEKVGHYMSDNQKLLQQLGVSIPKLDDMIDSAEKRGAYGAKLSGAGGGDCMIALAPEEKRGEVEETIQNAGGQILSIETHAQGVRIES